MPKVIITLTDNPDGETFSHVFAYDPPLESGAEPTPSQAMALAIEDRISAMRMSQPSVTILSGETVTMSQNQFNPCNN